MIAANFFKFELWVYSCHDVSSFWIGVKIFTGFYLSITSAKTIIYKFQPNVDKGYKLLARSIFKKELSNYFSVIEDPDHKDFGDKKYIVVHNNRNTAADPDFEEIEKILRD